MSQFLSKILWEPYYRPSRPVTGIAFMVTVGEKLQEMLLLVVHTCVKYQRDELLPTAVCVWFESGALYMYPLEESSSLYMRKRCPYDRSQRTVRVVSIVGTQ
jgi:hypothetical protein